MPRYIIPQPDGKFALYSTISDTFISQDLTKEELVDLSVEDATSVIKEETIRSLDRAFNKLKTIGPGIPYEEALANHIKNTQ